MNTQWLLPVMAAGVLIYLFRQKMISKKVFLLFVVLTGASAILMALEAQKGDLQEVTALSETKADNASETVGLVAETEDGKMHDIDLQIPEEKDTEAEIRKKLEEQVQKLDSTILGQNSGFDHVDRNLNLPAEAGEVTIQWSSDRPDLLNYDGTLTDSIPEGGEEVLLSATLYLEEQTEEYQRKLTVFPSVEELAVQSALQKESEVLNEDNSGGYILPDSLDGGEVVWYRKTQKKSPYLFAVILITALLLPAVARSREDEKEKKRQQHLEREFPELVSKLLLLLCAGLSVRKAFERIAGDYHRKKKQDGKIVESCEEVTRTYYEMENGTLETDAYRHFGERSNLPQYRELALLLTQNQQKGGADMIGLLRQELFNAMEERRRAARAEGEKMSIRMIVPMVMMLSVVLLIILVPAFLSF